MALGGSRSRIERLKVRGQTKNDFLSYIHYML